MQVLMIANSLCQVSTLSGGNGMLRTLSQPSYERMHWSRTHSGLTTSHAAGSSEKA